uniref:Major intrinsic family protein n=1 Tax=Zygnema circumcarinatum TaxID=35869 RepID=A0A6M3SL96_ZYGCR|nr:major intrinsic family protein [Zygnema circumcarinatum]
MAEAKRRSSSAYVQLDLSTPSAFNGDSSHEPREKYGDGSPFIPAVLSGDETVDLHEASGGSSASERAEKPSVQTMVEGAVKLVSMLNFMKAPDADEGRRGAGVGEGEGEEKDGREGGERRGQGTRRGDGEGDGGEEEWEETKEGRGEEARGGVGMGKEREGEREEVGPEAGDSARGTGAQATQVELGTPKSLRSLEQWRAAAAEYIATLIFVYIFSSVLSDRCLSFITFITGIISIELSAARLLVISVAHGLAIAFLAAATGAISGGHINPAVTIAFVVAGKETLLRAALYITAQVLGAVSGAALLQSATPIAWQGSLGSHNIANGLNGGQGFLMEVILTFVLIFVIFGVAVDRRGPGVIAPLPIGFAVVVDHLVGVPFTGASMNPARSFGPAFVTSQWGKSHWIYWVAPCLGAALAASVYRFVFLQAPVVLPETAPLKKTGSGIPPRGR